MGKTSHTKVHDTLYGLFIGDALAMPAHWYYNRQALNRDYGWITEYKAPHNPHPDSILWRSSYQAPNPKGEILHDQARFWGQQGIHYHQFLRAGENTLNVKICSLLIDIIKETGQYDPDAFLEKYIAFMTTPGNHRDTYIEECHRNFFNNYARGKLPHKCGVTEKHIGGLIGIVPIVAFYSRHSDKARKHALTHLGLTHPGHKMQTAASLIIEILLKIFNGSTLKAAIVDEIKSQRNPLVGHPFNDWLADPDDRVIGPRLSTACYVEDSVPAVIYLALKYHTGPEKALIANTNLGGDNAARGSILGALLGAACGIEKFPHHWVDGLVDPPPELT